MVDTMQSSNPNPLKRPHSPHHPPHSRRLRTRLSPATSSAASAASVSQDSAVFSTDRASSTEQTADSEPASANSDNSISSPSSSSSSSSEESEISDSSSGDDSSDADAESEGEEEEEEEEEVIGDEEGEFEDIENADGVVEIGRRKRKPLIKATSARKTGDLRARLKMFLPMLAAANEELEVERREGRLGGRMLDLGEGGVGEGEYIEMDLGLGVLEERDPDAEEESGSDEEDGMDILGKLMGQERAKEGGGIQVVDEA
ncbi:hypothetical protein BU16DRAFT_622376 [Lophium mytilinum]|uniref:Uncharacterized protein n=1 Tax=Lophium mytilinum TaxID=390894 RepID=A0A6A6QCD1_9PEZI|nr:hypothetical protein BU16DRAFT_622376 [Lophium mytilinum]